MKSSCDLQSLMYDKSGVWALVEFLSQLQNCIRLNHTDYILHGFDMLYSDLSVTQKNASIRLTVVLLWPPDLVCRAKELV